MVKRFEHSEKNNTEQERRKLVSQGWVCQNGELNFLELTQHVCNNPEITFRAATHFISDVVSDLADKSSLVQLTYPISEKFEGRWQDFTRAILPEPF